MTAYSSVLTDYVGEGIASSRPVSLNISATALGFYYATDTHVLSLWNGAAWVTVGGIVGQLPGTATNDSAVAGNVGEYTSSTVASGSAVALTTATPADVTGVSLTAGDWDVWGSVAFVLGAGTTYTSLAAWSSVTSATNPGAPNAGAFGLWTGSGVSPSPVVSAGQQRISVATTTTVHLSVQAAFAVSTLGAYGFIGARRAR